MKITIKQVGGKWVVILTDSTGAILDSRQCASEMEAAEVAKEWGDSGKW
jgi:hypothetical protein